MGILVKSMSFSTMNEYTAGCPEKVYLDKIDHRQRKGVSAAALLGSSFHAVVETYYRSLLLNHILDKNDEAIEKILFRVFVNRWNQVNDSEIFYNNKKKNDLFTKGKQLIHLLVTAEKPYQLLATEKQMEFQLTSDLKVLCKPDLIYRDKDGWLTITDVKTSSKAYGDDEKYNALSQLFTYAQKISEPVKLRVFLFVKTKEPRFETIVLNPDDMNYSEWKERFLATKRGIESGLRYRVRSFKCKTCSFSYICNRKDDAIESFHPQQYRKAA